jgi:hypothetical protein
LLFQADERRGIPAEEERTATFRADLTLHLQRPERDTLLGVSPIFWL